MEAAESVAAETLFGEYTADASVASRVAYLFGGVVVAIRASSS